MAARRAGTPAPTLGRGGHRRGRPAGASEARAHARARRASRRVPARPRAKIRQAAWIPLLEVEEPVLVVAHEPVRRFPRSPVARRAAADVDRSGIPSDRQAPAGLGKTPAEVLVLVEEREPLVPAADLAPGGAADDRAAERQPRDRLDPLRLRVRRPRDREADRLPGGPRATCRSRVLYRSPDFWGEPSSNRRRAPLAPTSCRCSSTSASFAGVRGSTNASLLSSSTYSLRASSRPRLSRAWMLVPGAEITRTRSAFSRRVGRCRPSIPRRQPAPRRLSLSAPRASRQRSSRAPEFRLGMTAEMFTCWPRRLSGV